MSLKDAINNIDRAKKPFKTIVTEKDGRKWEETIHPDGTIQRTLLQQQHESLEEKYTALKELIDKAKYIVFYSGAGISASAGIGTFQGENAMGSILNLREEVLDFKMPTYSHMAITRMIEAGKVKFVVSSNHDNMHRKSGTPDNYLAELFGNAYVEVCTKCKKQYQRMVICPPTNRICDDPQCKGKLIKSGVRYGQATPEEPLRKGFYHSDKADLSIVLGSSMGTSPFCDMPPRAKSMVLCNLGHTRYDSAAALTFNLPCDEFMRKVVPIMGINLGTYTYSQTFELGYKKIADATYKLFLKGHRQNEPCTCVASVTVLCNGLEKELDQSNLTKNFEVEIRSQNGTNLPIQVTFREEYNCAPMAVNFSLDKDEELKILEFQKVVNYDE